MNNAFFEVPIPINEPVKDYVNGGYACDDFD